MRRNIPDRDITFRYEEGCLIRTVSGSDGRSYTHRCSREAFEAVAWVLQRLEGEIRSVTVAQIAGASSLPHTQVDVTLAFLDERGIVQRRGRRAYPASPSVHLDAMIEWHALREVPM
jgi:hypothetical protein